MKLNKILILTSFSILSILAGCSKNPQEDIPEDVSAQEELLDESDGEIIEFATSTMDVKGELKHKLNFTWTVNDTLHVYDGTSYCGYVALISGAGTNNAVFRGRVSLSPSATEVTFLYVGAALDIPKTSTTFDFQDQSELGTLDDAMDHFIASCTLPRATNGRGYSGTMNLHFSIGKFYLNPLEFTDNNVYIFGLAQKINISAGGVISYEFTEGMRTVFKTKSRKTDYYIIMPIASSSTSLTFTNTSGSKVCVFKKAELRNNIYYSDDGGSIWVELTPRVLQQDYTSGVIPMEVTVGTDRHVAFTTGNLWFQSGNGTVHQPKWAMADKQYHYLGNGITCSKPIGVSSGNTVTDSDTRTTQSAWIDLLPWGCTGYLDENYNTGQLYCHPWLLYSGNSSSYNSQYGPSGFHDLSYAGHSDWGWLAQTDGIYTSSSGSTSITGSDKFRTLTYQEFRTAMSRTYTDGDGETCYLSFFAKLIDESAVPSAVAGIVILDDNDRTHGVRDQFDNNWISTIPADAAFLPAASAIDMAALKSTALGKEAFYWTSSSVIESGGSVTDEKLISLTPDSGIRLKMVSNPDGTGELELKKNSRSSGMAVRLVKDL